jgi:hypothetical protein
MAYVSTAQILFTFSLGCTLEQISPLKSWHDLLNKVPCQDETCIRRKHEQVKLVKGNLLLCTRIYLLLEKGDFWCKFSLAFFKILPLVLFRHSAFKNQILRERLVTCAARPTGKHII